MKFFRVIANPTFRDPWFLDEPQSEDGTVIDAREFTRGEPYAGLVPVRLPIAQPGQVTEFTFAAFDMPVVSNRVGTILERVAPNEIERIPVVVGSSHRGFEILNVTSKAKCLDESRSQVLKWKLEDRRPDRVGKYRMVTGITIEPNCVSGKHIFRIKGWEIALIVSEVLKDAIQDVPNLAVIFETVC